MATISYSIRIPEAMLPYLDDEYGERSFERNAMILYPYIQDMTISHGRAAEILGVHKFDLIDFYCSMGLPYLNQSIDDLKDEIADMHKYEGAAG